VVKRCSRSTRPTLPREFLVFFLGFLTMIIYPYKRQGIGYLDPMPCSFVAALVQRFTCKLDQRHVAGTFYREGHFTLVLCTGTCLASGADFTFPVNKARE